MILDELFEAGPAIDNVHGMGAVGISSNIDYMGLRVYIKPSVFLKLAYSHPNLDTTYIQQQLSLGKAIGAPFLSIEIPESWIAPDSHYDKVKEGDLTEPARVTGHEGRHRMAAIMKEYGDVPIETHLLFNGLRRRHITDNMVERLNGNILNEQGKLFDGPWFSLTETVTEAVDLDFVDRNFLRDIKHYNILVALHNILSRYDRDLRFNRDVSIYTDTVAKHKTLIISKLLIRMKESVGKTEFELIANAVSQLVKHLHIDWPELKVIIQSCKAQIAALPADHPDDYLNENFADGKGPGRPGDSHRHGIPKHASLATLDKLSKQGGRKGQLAHWQANMRRGRAKTNENDDDEYDEYDDDMDNDVEYYDYDPDATIDPDAINDIVAAVPEAQEIWFHGSRAIGGWHDDSDWDLLVVVPDTIRGKSAIELNDTLHTIAAKYPNYDIQSAWPDENITLVTKEEGQLLWSATSDVTEAIAPHGDSQNELRMMVAGTKPAALLNPTVYDELYRPLADRMGWEVVAYTIPGFGDEPFHVVAQHGDRARAKRIAKLVQDANASGKVTQDYHRELGTLLGYSKDDINDFIKKIYGNQAEIVNENELGSYMPFTMAQLKELLSTVRDQLEAVDDQSFNVNPDTTAYKQIERDYQALTAIEYVVKNNIKALQNPALQPGAIFVYDWDGYEDEIGAIQVQVTNGAAEIKWLGSYNSIGKQLIAKGLEQAKQLGAKKVNLTSKWGSGEYYKKQGFKQADDVADNPITDTGASYTKDIDEASQQYKKISPELIKEIVAKVPQTREIWFHGSRAIGKHKRNSDWDILVVVPDSIKGNTYIDIIELLQNIARNYPNYDIQPAHPRNMITNIAREEGLLLWSHKPPVTEAIAPHGDPNNELRMMKAGTKPAAIIGPVEFEHMYKPLVNDYGWEVVTFNNNYGRRYVVGQMGEYARVKRIADLVDTMNRRMEQGVRATNEYHIQLGRLLGYSEQDIKDFLEKLAKKS